ncbi:hypothetical protein CVH10_03845 [Halomonas sp. ND22Bw]|uniref:YfhG lipoprotein n=1 Tax=Halomonas salina TaxID=42565 RepID=A0ABR4WRA2_9GAMM|nr:hypothetical protein [Halomonas salina]KGE77264.1 hypothetical protein FP66_11100 [Halomonas salina]PSJ23032.1 hypothetical protein CVH10_03845 [Halomonas sp. ND22Bw]
MKIPRPLLLCLLSAGLTGCQWLPQNLSGEPREPVVEESAGCYAELPDFGDRECLLEEWTAFGLASQRGDRDWRDVTLTRLSGESHDQRLARAVVLAWGNEREWDQASELYKADLHAAPARLQPLLRYWLNELEGRRALGQRLAESRRAQRALEEEKAALDEKLDALTDIERNINSRQQTE